MGVLRVFLIWIVLAIPIYGFGADLRLKLDEKHVFSLENVVLEGDVSYYWETDGAEWETTEPKDTISWDEAGLHTLSAWVVYNGCISRISTIEIEVIDELHLPELIPDKFFTPDGDGVHEFWWIKNIEYYPNSIIEIYDRFSKLLVKYKGTDFIDLKGWDGIYNGHQMPSDDYWYYIKDILPNKPKSGHFILKRGNK